MAQRVRRERRLAARDPRALHGGRYARDDRGRAGRPAEERRVALARVAGIERVAVAECRDEVSPALHVEAASVVGERQAPALSVARADEDRAGVARRPHEPTLAFGRVEIQASVAGWLDHGDALRRRRGDRIEDRRVPFDGSGAERARVGVLELDQQHAAARERRGGHADRVRRVHAEFVGADRGQEERRGGRDPVDPVFVGQRAEDAEHRAAVVGEAQERRLRAEDRARVEPEVLVAEEPAELDVGDRRSRAVCARHERGIDPAHAPGRRGEVTFARGEIRGGRSDVARRVLGHARGRGAFHERQAVQRVAEPGGVDVGGQRDPVVEVEIG
jgi:hypothetical protein